jgi:hypothetical protein
VADDRKDAGDRREIQAMLEYLQDKYGGSFEAERLVKGSKWFAKMYGGDKLLVHPAGQPELPFYVHENVISEGYNDNYVMANFSVQFTKKHQQSIEELDSRIKGVKFGFGCANWPDSAEDLTIPVETFAQDLSYDCDLNLLVALVPEGDLDVDRDENFLYRLYDSMKKITNRYFFVSVGYVIEDQIDFAKEYIRLGHTRDYHWTQLEPPVVTRHIEFDRDDDIQDASYFDKFLKDVEEKMPTQ